LKNLFKDAYLNHDNLADATRHLANLFLANLVNFDADDAKSVVLFLLQKKT
jgi:hypothetical protein